MSTDHEHSANVRFQRGTNKIEVFCEDPNCNWTVEYEPETETHRESFGDSVYKLLNSRNRLGMEQSRV